MLDNGKSEVNKKKREMLKIHGRREEREGGGGKGHLFLLSRSCSAATLKRQ